jgi:hypothetical protein
VKNAILILIHSDDVVMVVDAINLGAGGARESDGRDVASFV